MNRRSFFRLITGLVASMAMNPMDFLTPHDTSFENHPFYAIQMESNLLLDRLQEEFVREYTRRWAEKIDREIMNA